METITPLPQQWRVGFTNGSELGVWANEYRTTDLYYLFTISVTASPDEDGYDFLAIDDRPAQDPEHITVIVARIPADLVDHVTAEPWPGWRNVEWIDP